MDYVKKGCCDAAEMGRIAKAVEALPGRAAVEREWRDLLGEDYAACREFLRPTDHRALAYPCPSPGGVGCPRTVVVHDNGEIVAVCGDQPKMCDRLVLTDRDIAVWEFDVQKFCAAAGGSVVG